MVPLSTDDPPAQGQPHRIPELPLPDEWYLRPSVFTRYRMYVVLVAVALVTFNVVIPSGWTRVMPPVAWVVVLLVFFGAAVFVLQRWLRRFNSAAMAANAALARGEIEAAGAAFESLARSYRSDAGLHAVAVYHVGVVRYKLGDQHAALACFGVAARTRGVADRNPLVAECAPYVIANCYTLLGDLDAAEHWLSEGRRRGRLRHWPMDVPSEALIRCRRSEYLAAQQLLRSRWREMEGMLPAELVREISLICAFAQARTEGVRDVRALVPGIDDADLRRYAYYGQAWPEFRKFLASLEGR